MKEGWTYKKLGEIAKVQNGFAFDSKLFNENKKGTPLIRIRDIKRGYSYTYTTESCSIDYNVENGDLLIGMDGDFNVCVWKGGHAYLNQRVCRIVPSDAILARYLFYLLPFPLKRINDKTTYATVKHLSAKQVLEIDVPNIPLSEQQRIVKQLDETFAEIDTIKAAAEKQLSEAKALFQKALSKAMTPKDGWTCKKLGDVCEIERGKRFVRADIVQEGIPCIHYGDIYTYYGLSTTKTKGYLKPDLAKLMRFAKKNDVIVVQAGENNWDIGVGLAYFGEEPAAVHDACFILRHKQNPMYISYYLRTFEYHRYLRDYVHEGKICSFLKPALEKAPFSIPPLSEQQRIVEELDELAENVKEIEKLNNKLTAECDAMKQALLRQVFE